MYRLLVIGSVLLWVTAMSALFMRDVWPAWTAQDAPPITPTILSQLDAKHRQEQYGIFNGDGLRIGTAWNEVRAGSTTTLEGTALLSFPPLPEVRIENMTEFAADGALDSFNLDVFGVPFTLIKVRGERRGIYFPCELDIGPVRRQANLELSASRLIGDTLRPFSFLPTLTVGQSWRMQLLDPMSAIVSRRTEFTSIIARVIGEEAIDSQGSSVRCKVVETSPQHVRAWVDPDGRVLLQEADVPGLGRLRVRQEPFNAHARELARDRVRAGRLPAPERE